MLWSQFINGLTLGCIYALTALAYTLIFGVIRLIHFALGELLMLGAFFAIGLSMFFFSQPTSMWGFIIQFFLITLIATSLVIVVGIVIELIAFRPLRRKRETPILLGLISSLGISIFLQNFVLVFIGSGNVKFPNIIPFKEINLGFGIITSIQVAIILISMMMMMFLYFLVYRTKFGREIRGIRDNRDLALASGTNINQVIVLTFALASVFVSLAGIMIGAYYGVARYNMGFVPGIKAFSAAILGGVGYVPGGMLGGIVIGMVESLGSGYVSAEYKDVFAFAVLIVVLLFKPKGLLNKGIL